MVYWATVREHEDDGVVLEIVRDGVEVVGESKRYATANDAIAASGIPPEKWAELLPIPLDTDGEVVVLFESEAWS